MTGDYYSINSAWLQPVSEVADLVDRASVTFTACNKQTDRRRTPIPSLQARWGVCTLQEC